MKAKEFFKKIGKGKRLFWSTQFTPRLLFGPDVPRETALYAEVVRIGGYQIEWGAFGIDPEANWVATVSRVGLRYKITYLRLVDENDRRRTFKTLTAAQIYAETLWFRYGKPIWRASQ